MRKAFGLLALLCLVALPAQALPGLDGDRYGHGWFAISVQEGASNLEPAAPRPADRYSLHQFSFADGWDFGDRYGYRCAWVEFFVGSDEKFEVHYELEQDYPFVVDINDKYGAEDENRPKGAINSLCGTGVTSPGISKGGIP